MKYVTSRLEIVDSESMPPGVHLTAMILDNSADPMVSLPTPWSSLDDGPPNTFSGAKMRLSQLRALLRHTREGFARARDRYIEELQGETE